MLSLGTKVVLGNWKMCGTMSSSVELAEGCSSVADEVYECNVTVGVAPSFIHLPLVLAHGDGLIVGAQNASEQDNGAFTGEVSIEQLADMGVDFVILGHSERRHKYGETSALVRAKIEKALAHGLHVVLCVGETAEERENGRYLQAVEEQLRASLPKSWGEGMLTVSYEPVWAIGTGKTASAQDIAEMQSNLSRILGELVPQNALPKVLYGGSVKPDNALEIMSIPVVDGVLVGGASLELASFTSIIHAACKAASGR